MRFCILILCWISTFVFLSIRLIPSIALSIAHCWKCSWSTLFFITDTVSRQRALHKRRKFFSSSLFGYFYYQKYTLFSRSPSQTYSTPYLRCLIPFSCKHVPKYLVHLIFPSFLVCYCLSKQYHRQIEGGANRSRRCLCLWPTTVTT